MKLDKEGHEASRRFLDMMSATSGMRVVPTIHYCDLYNEQCLTITEQSTSLEKMGMEYQEILVFSFAHLGDGKTLGLLTNVPLPLPLPV